MLPSKKRQKKGIYTHNLVGELDHGKKVKRSKNPSDFGVHRA